MYITHRYIHTYQTYIQIYFTVFADDCLALKILVHENSLLRITDFT